MRVTLILVALCGGFAAGIVARDALQAEASSVSGGSSVTLATGSGGAVGASGPIAVTGPVSVTGQAYSVLPTTGVTAGTSYTVNWATGNGQAFDADGSTGNVTFTFSNPAAGASYVLKTIQGPTGRTYTWPATVKWPAGVAPTATATNNAVDLYSCFFDGTNYLCSSAMDIR